MPNSQAGDAGLKKSDSSSVWYPRIPAIPAPQNHRTTDDVRRKPAVKTKADEEIEGFIHDRLTIIEQPHEKSQLHCPTNPEERPCSLQKFGVGHTHGGVQVLIDDVAASSCRPSG
jgi:hypothetical protein